MTYKIWTFKLNTFMDLCIFVKHISYLASIVWHLASISFSSRDSDLASKAVLKARKTPLLICFIFIVWFSANIILSSSNSLSTVKAVLKAKQVSQGYMLFGCVLQTLRDIHNNIKSWWRIYIRCEFKTMYVYLFK